MSAGAVRGHAGGAAQGIEDTMTFADLHRIKPMVETMPLADVAIGYDRMMANKARFHVLFSHQARTSGPKFSQVVLSGGRGEQRDVFVHPVFDRTWGVAGQIENGGRGHRVNVVAGECVDPEKRIDEQFWQLGGFRHGALLGFGSGVVLDAGPQRRGDVAGDLVHRHGGGSGDVIHLAGMAPGAVGEDDREDRRHVAAVDYGSCDAWT
jgi:hypothetical protein